MTMTRNAMGNLMARYKTVLQNCSLVNTFGSLAAAITLTSAVVLGGASEVMAETLSYQDKVVESASGNAQGGAIWNKKDVVYGNIDAIFTNNRVSGGVASYGGAIQNQGTIGDILGSFSGNTASSTTAIAYGGAINNSGIIGDINANFTDNKAISTSNNVAGGAINNYNIIGDINGDFMNNSVATEQGTAKGGAIYSHVEVGTITGDFVGNSAASNTNIAQGGAVWVGLKSGNADLTLQNSAIKNNTAKGNVALGGAIYATVNAGVNFLYDANASAEQLLISGNTVSSTGNAASAGGFLYLNSGASANFAVGEGVTLTVGNADFDYSSDTNMDSFAGVAGTTITKTGAGDMVVNSSLNDFAGAFRIESGNVTLTQDWIVAGSASLNSGSLVVGKGVSTTWLAERMGIIGISSDVVLGIYGSPLDVSSSLGGVTVGTTAAPSSAGSIIFGSNSLLVLDAGAGLIANSISTEKGASLFVTGLGSVFLENADIANGSWGIGDVGGSTIFFDSAFIKATESSYANGVYSFTVAQVSATEALPTIDAGLGGLIDKAIKGDISSAGVNFIKEASKKNNGAVVIESAAKLSTGANVTGAVGSASTAAVANTGARTSVAGSKTSAASESSTWLAMNGDALIIPTVDGGNMTQGFGLWFMPMYNQTSADGFKSGNHSYGYDTSLVGATLGADYTFASDFRLGLAFNMGEGNSSSTGDFTSTDNDFNYYGMSLYGAKHFANIGLSFDMGYMFSENDMMQNADAGVIGSSVDAGLFTIGTKAEYVIALDSFNVVPYAGLRFNYYNVDAYDTKQKGNTLFSTASSNSSVWEIPVGVTFDTTTKVGAWDMTPSLGLGVKFAMGDLDADQNVSIAGVAGSSVLSSEVVDGVTFQGSLGLGFTKDVCTIGLNYNLDLSENVKSHGVSVNLRYDF